MNSRIIFTVFAKELRDLLRDRRTIISMIVVPTLLMPALMALIVFVGVTAAFALEDYREGRDERQYRERMVGGLRASLNDIVVHQGEIERDGYAAKDQRSAGREAVRVVTQSNA